MRGLLPLQIPPNSRHFPLLLQHIKQRWITAPADMHLPSLIRWRPPVIESHDMRTVHICLALPFVEACGFQWRLDAIFKTSHCSSNCSVWLDEYGVRPGDDKGFRCCGYRYETPYHSSPHHSFPLSLITPGSLLVTRTFVSFWQVIHQAVASVNVLSPAHKSVLRVYGRENVSPARTHPGFLTDWELAYKIDHDSWRRAAPFPRDRYILQSHRFPAFPTPSQEWLIIPCLGFGIHLGCSG